MKITFDVTPAEFREIVENKQGAETNPAPHSALSALSALFGKPKNGSHEMRERLTELFDDGDFRGMIETMAHNPGDKGDIRKMISSFDELFDYGD